MSNYFKALQPCQYCKQSPAWQHFRRTNAGGLSPQDTAEHHYRVQCECAAAKATVHGAQPERHTTAIETLVSVYYDGVYAANGVRSDIPSTPDTNSQTSDPTHTEDDPAVV